ncbi:hypothetical protein Tco_1330564, partial [Tanacetum coccineum]
GEEDDDNDDDNDNDDDDGNDDDDDGSDDGDNDDNDDDSDHERTESDRDENPNLNLSSTQDDEEEEESERVYTPPELVPTNDEENIDDEEQMDEEEDDKVTKELYKDVNMNLGNKDADMTNANQKTEGLMQSSYVSSDFIKKLLNFENVSPTKNEIASLMDTIVHHEEPSDQTSSLFTILITVIPEITSTFTITIPPQHPFFNPLPQQATSTPTPTTSEVTTSFPALLDFASVFRFNERVTNLEKDMSEMKQVDQYAQAISSIPAIILPQGVSEFATLVIELNITESLEAAVLAKSFSQPKSTYEAAASLSEFELTKILMDKMKEQTLYFRADYKRELYDTLVKSYNTNKDLFDTYGEVFTLKRSRDNKDKDQDPSAGSDRGMKRRKSSKEVESSRDPKSKESKSTSSSKEFDTGNNDEQLDDDAISMSNWYKKPEQPLTPDPNWNKRQHVDFKPSQTWISNIARAKEPRTSFDELMDTPIDFSAFVMNRLNITNLTQELLVGPAFNLLKGTCKSRTELEYHFEECRHVIPFDYFINNDLEYLKDRSLSRKFSTSITKTKAATYEVQWIKDMVPNICSPIKFASNKMSSKDVYSIKHIIAVTSLKIMKRYDYGHLDEIEVHREDQQLYKFKEGDFPRLLLQDIEDMLLLLVQQKLTNLTIDEHFNLNVALRMFTRRIVIQRLVEDLQLAVESYQKKLNPTKPDIFSDGALNNVRTALHDITSEIRMEYLPKRKWSGLDKRRARVMI